MCRCLSTLEVVCFLRLEIQPCARVHTWHTAQARWWEAYGTYFPADGAMYRGEVPPLYDSPDRLLLGAMASREQKCQVPCSLLKGKPWCCEMKPLQSMTTSDLWLPRHARYKP